MDARKHTQVPHVVVKQEVDEIVVPGGEGKGAAAASNPQVTSGLVGSGIAASSSGKRAAKRSSTSEKRRRRSGRSEENKRERRRSLVLALDEDEEEELNPCPMQQEKTVKEVIIRSSEEGLKKKKLAMKDKQAAPPAVQAVKEEIEAMQVQVQAIQAPVVQVAQESEAVVEKKKKRALVSSSRKKTEAAEKKTQADEKKKKKKNATISRVQERKAILTGTQTQKMKLSREAVEEPNEEAEVPNLTVQQHAIEEAPVITETVQEQQQQLEDDEYAVVRVRKFDGLRVLDKVDRTEHTGGVGSRTRLRKKQQRRRGQSGTPNSVGRGTCSDPIDLE